MCLKSKTPKRKKICVSTYYKNYRARIDWGDGKIEDFSKLEENGKLEDFNLEENKESEKITHMYSFPGVYRIRITDLGGFSHVQLPTQTCEVLSIGKITSCKNLLAGCNAFNTPLKLDTSAVTDMSGIFDHCLSFNQPLMIDTLNVTNMSNMFTYCVIFNQPLHFDTKNMAT